MNSEKHHPRQPLSAVVLIWLFITVLPVPSHAEEDGAQLAGQSTALTSIGVVDDLDAPPDPDDPGMGGGFDAVNYFQNILVEKVAECTKGVLKEFETWTRNQALVISRTVQASSSLLAYAALTDPTGVLELSYRFNASQKRARATLFFYSNDGKQHEPAAIKAFLKQYKVDSFEDRLRAAVACKQGLFREPV